MQQQSDIPARRNLLFSTVTDACQEKKCMPHRLLGFGSSLAFFVFVRCLLVTQANLCLIHLQLSDYGAICGECARGISSKIFVCNVVLVFYARIQLCF